MPRMIRWTAPLGAAALIAVGAIALSPSAQADPALPPRTAEQLVTDVLQSEAPSYVGTVVTRTELGLPDLSALGERGSNLSTLLSGSHTARVWADGADRQRVAVADGSHETVAVRNGATRWVWSSAEQTATRITGGGHDRWSDRSGSTPADMARTMLTEVGKTSQITTSTTSTVAGRAAYDLVVRPTQQGTKVGRVTMAIDAETHLPLRLQIFSGAATQPSVELAFTDITYQQPDAGLFDFTPPSGATVREVAGKDKRPDARGRSDRPGDRAPVVSGTGWITVAVTEIPTTVDSATRPGQPTGPQERAERREQVEQLLGQLPRVNGTWGSGRLIDGPLFSAVVTDDGRVAAGAVEPELLFAALS